MNRAQRRRLKREAYKDEPIYEIKQSDYFAISQKYSKIATHEAFAYLAGIAVELMAEEFDWNVEDCNWLVQKLTERYNAIDNLDALIESTRQKSGMVITRDKR